MNSNIPKFSIVTRKDGSGYLNTKEFGSNYLVFMGISPHNPEIAVLSQCRQHVVGFHNEQPIMALPQSTLIFEKLDNLVLASDNILKELGLL